jgi:hypothetical protein
VIPQKMLARHCETKQWSVLLFGAEAWSLWKKQPEQCYYIDTGCEPRAVDLNDYDFFEGIGG